MSVDVAVTARGPAFHLPETIPAAARGVITVTMVGVRGVEAVRPADFHAVDDEHRRVALTPDGLGNLPAASRGNPTASTSVVAPGQQLTFTLSGTFEHAPALGRRRADMQGQVQRRGLAVRHDERTHTGRVEEPAAREVDDDTFEPAGSAPSARAAASLRARPADSVQQELGHLHRVERRALAQVVAGDPEVDRARAPTGPRAPGRRAPGRSRPPRAASGSRRRRRSSRTPGASRSSSTASALRHRAVEPDVGATSRGRRTPAPART